MKPAAALIQTTGVFLTVALCGCRSIGPGTISRDRLDYSEAIADQDWKSKRTFSAIMFLFTLNDSSTVEERLPMLTIPTS